MYEVFYNFQAEPFRLSPDHKFCYEHKGYARARAYMAYAFMRAEGFVMITGRPGTGKTTLIGELVENLARDSVSTANLVCTQLQADDLLKTVAYNFGVSAERADKAELLERLNRLLHRWHRDGRRALLIVDEAQDLSASAMEELRLLTNIQVDGQPLLQIFLLGQPELRELILSPGMEQVHQRIVAACHLEGLEEDEVEAYVLHRLQRVGWKGDPAISRAVFPLLHKFSEGVPRRINLICSRLFLHCGVEQRHEMVPADLEVVIRELQAENLAAGKGMSRDEFVIFEDRGWVECPVEPQEPGASEEMAAAEMSRDEVEAPDESDWIEDEEIEEPAASGQVGGEVHLRAVASEPRGVADRDSPAVAEQVVSKKKSRPAPTIATNPGSIPDSRATIPVSGSGAAQEQSAVDSMVHQRTGSHARPARVSAEGSRSGRSPNPDASVLSSDPVPDATGVGPSGAAAGFPASGGSSESAPNPRRHDSSWAILMLLLVLLLFVGVAAVYLFAPRLQWNETAFFEPRATYTQTGDVRATLRAADSPTSGEPTAANTKTPAVGRSGSGAGQDTDTLSGAVAPAEPADPPPVGLQQSGRQAAGEGAVDRDPPSPNEAAPDGRAGAETSVADAQLPEQTVAPAAANVEQAAARSPGGDLTMLVGFSPDSTNLDREARFVLDEAVRVLRRNAQNTALITGHPDGLGDEAYNSALSRERALVVEDYLLAAGVDRQRLSVHGREPVSGETVPLSEDSGPDREQYRIVTIQINRGGSP